MEERPQPAAGPSATAGPDQAQTVETVATPSETAKLSIGTRIGWGLGAFPMSAIGLAAGPLLIRYMTDTLGVAAALAGTIFSLSKIWNAVADPVIGYLADRVNTRWGRRLPCLLAGGLASVLVLVLTYTAPVDHALLPVFLLFMLLLFASTYTLFMVPYTAMPAEMTTSYHGRSQLMALRVAFTSGGTFIGAGLAPMMLDWWGATRAGHLKMACALAAISAVTVLLCVWLLRDAPGGAAPPRRHAHAPFFRGFVSALAIRPFVWLLCSKILYYLTLSFSLTALPFFTKHVMNASDSLLGLFLVCQTATVILAQPFWLKMARWLDKRGAYLIAAALYAAMCLSFWFAGPGEPTALTLFRAVVWGVAGGGTFLLSQAMLPDVMEYDRLVTGARREGTIAGIFIMAEQIATALGIALFGWLLGAFNYVGAVEGAKVEQPADAIFALRLCITLIPTVFMILSMVSISRYSLSRVSLLRLREEKAVV